jgi:hypothetical protein
MFSSLIRDHSGSTGDPGILVPARMNAEMILMTKSDPENLQHQGLKVRLL